MLWLPRVHVRLSMIWRLFRSTKVGEPVSGPMGLRPVTLIVPKRVPGMNKRFAAKSRFSRLAVRSNAWFHATFTSFNSVADSTHLYSPTTFCDFVRGSAGSYWARVAPNWLRSSGGIGLVGSSKYVRESNLLSRPNSNADPDSSFVPERVTATTMPPLLRPYSAL